MLSGMSDDSEEDNFEIQLDDYREKEMTNGETFKQLENVQNDRWIRFLNLGSNNAENKCHYSKIENFQASIVSDDVKEFLRLVQEEGCSVDQNFPVSFDSCGKNPTFLACEHGSVQILEHLLKNKVRAPKRESNIISRLMFSYYLELKFCCIIYIRN